MAAYVVLWGFDVEHENSQSQIHVGEGSRTHLLAEARDEEI
jgi:hypothetical protein